MNIDLQKDWKDCGLYCLKSFYNYYYNKNIDISILKNNANYGIKGINILELNKVANRISLKIESFKINFEELMAYKNKKPFIALVESNGYSHYVIIRKKSKNFLYILDPLKGKIKIDLKKFKNKFLGIILLINKSKINAEILTRNELLKYFLEYKKIFFLL